MAAVNSKSKTSLRLHRFRCEDLQLHSPPILVQTKRKAKKIVPAVSTGASPKRGELTKNNSENYLQSKNNEIRESQIMIEEEEDEIYAKSTPTTPTLSLDKDGTEFLDDSNFSKIEREHYFHAQIHFILCLTTIPNSLKPWKSKLSRPELNEKLSKRHFFFWLEK